MRYSERGETSINYDITVFLIKSEITEFEKVIDKNSGQYNDYPIKEPLGISGKVYIGENRESEPKWNRLLDKGLENYVVQANKSSRAVLLIRHLDRIFAFTFGYGRHMLKNDAYVRGFGLRVILNNIIDGNLKSVDTSILDLNSFNSRIQTTQATLLENFNITDIRTMYKSISAESMEPDKYGKVISGRDSFHFTYKLDFNNITQICSDLLKDYYDERYKEHFEDIDRIRLVEDPSKLDELDQILINRFVNEEISSFHIPEFIKWENVMGFSFTKMARKDLDLSIERFFTEKSVDKGRINKEYLKRHKIFCEFIDDEPQNWSLYDCIYTMVQDVDDAIYYFNAGEWFKVDGDFINDIDEYIKNIDTTPLNFPIIDGEYEKYANEILQENITDSINLDSKNAVIHGDKYEVCDILTACKRFIHVKWWDSSANMSHLFSQGRISASFLLNDPSQRESLYNLIKDENKNARDIIDIESYNPADYTVVYAIIYKEDLEIHERLPLFSKLNLKQNVRLLRNMNYNVEIIHYKTTKSRTKNTR